MTLRDEYLSLNRLDRRKEGHHPAIAPARGLLLGLALSTILWLSGFVVWMVF